MSAGSLAVRFPRLSLALLAVLFGAISFGIAPAASASGGYDEEVHNYDGLHQRAGPTLHADPSSGGFDNAATASLAHSQAQIDAPSLSSDDLYATNTTRIFRAVEPDELADLRDFGRFRAGGPYAEWMDGKRFGMSQADADAYVALATKADFGGPYCVTSGCIPNEVLDQIQVVTMDGMDAVFIPNDLLPFIDDLKLPSPP